MKSRKRILAVLLIMAVSSLAWSKNQAESNVEATGDAEVVTLTWVVIGDQTPDMDKVLEEFNKKLQDKLPNTELKILTYGFGNYADRIELMITAGEDFDIMWCSSWAGDYLQKVANGAFMPLDDLIDNHAPKLKEVLPETVFQTGTYDGKMYGLTNYQQLWNGYGYIARKDWAEKYGLDYEQIEKDGFDRSIKTIDIMKSMEPYFANILKNEMDSGINSVIDPYFLVEKTVTENMIMERDYETIVSPAVIDKFNNDSVQLVNMFKTQEYKDFIDWMRDMYNRDFIRLDVLSAQLPTNIDDDRLNTYGIMTTNTGTPDDFTLELNNIFSTQEVISGRTAPLYLPYTAGTATMNFINAKTPNAERAIKLLEIINTDKEMFNLLHLGIEGEHWEAVPGASDTEIPSKILKPGAYSIFDWVLGNVGNSADRSKLFLDSRLTKWNNQATKSPLFGFVPDLAELTSDKAKIDAVVNEFVKPLNSGADDDYEKHYEEFIKKLDSAGVEEFIAKLQMQVDAYLGQ
ncbi:MAG: ABC transporter substrate-binding protein [Spirochaetaceae bacterium]